MATTERKTTAEKPVEAEAEAEKPAAPVAVLSLEDMLEKARQEGREAGRQETIEVLSLREARQVEAQRANGSQEGYAAFLDEQDRGGAPEVVNRRSKPTTGAGNDLPKAPYYRVFAPARDPKTGERCYTGITMGLPFQNGFALTDNRQLAWLLREDFGYSVEAEMRTEVVVPVPLVPTAGREVAHPG